MHHLQADSVEATDRCTNCQAARMWFSAARMACSMCALDWCKWRPSMVLHAKIFYTKAGRKESQLPKRRSFQLLVCRLEREGCRDGTKAVHV
ncbi:hypothetical protein M5689_010478 [Euphorbia peplus]|nr:hypothetical protein M5689_010478 [Euphorbia peplus]